MVTPSKAKEIGSKSSTKSGLTFNVSMCFGFWRATPRCPEKGTGGRGGGNNVTKIYSLPVAHHQLKLREISETEGFTKDRVGHISCMKYWSLEISWSAMDAAFSPSGQHGSTVKPIQSNVWRCLSVIRRSFWSFSDHRRNTQIQWCAPQIKEMSKQWMHPAKVLRSRLSKTVLSAKKAVVTVFWNSEGAI